MREIDWLEKAGIAACTVLALFCVMLVVFMGYLFGYGVGLWGAPCQIESGQPKCIKAGWNGGTYHVVHEGKH